ncbi:hypothetical protein AVEN_115091-1 [Araneus ventricosus]|uniref:Uncharacterized protein n=1 Tax=Araneus ventricosus TaxID=182803 RepID=A0A4Y1ZXE6_ARAVE|nr:hypothetical protein AVEN_115091-1 [Araneus ventricosus]
MILDTLMDSKLKINRKVRGRGGLEARSHPVTGASHVRNSIPLIRLVWGLLQAKSYVVAKRHHTQCPNALPLVRCGSLERGASSGVFLAI